ncbi:histone deacetylase domain-containing protein [Zopfochytrium polystomum]|nr:histone deacetylase domain-containing protein [Zopfochytrium polystomum]
MSDDAPPTSSACGGGGGNGFDGNGDSSGDGDGNVDVGAPPLQQKRRRRSSSNATAALPASAASAGAAPTPTPTLCVYSDVKCLGHRGNEGSKESSGEVPRRITAVLHAFAQWAADESFETTAAATAAAAQLQLDQFRIELQHRSQLIHQAVEKKGGEGEEESGDSAFAIGRAEAGESDSGGAYDAALCAMFPTAGRGRVSLVTNQSKPACVSQLLRAHSPQYVTRLLNLAPFYATGKKGMVHFSPGLGGAKTSFLTNGSLDAILAAAGVVVHAVDDAFQQRRSDGGGSGGGSSSSSQPQPPPAPSHHTRSRSFCVVRPPGHHCGRNGVELLDSAADLALGFCFVNNVAVGALHAVDKYRARVAILDFDVHHGNGTEGIVRHHLSVFKAATTATGKTSPPPAFPVLFASVHQYEPATDADGDTQQQQQQEPFFPGTGGIVAEGDPAHGHVVNCPLPPHAGSAEFRAALSAHVFPKFRDFAPDLIMISAGFDSHADDEVGDLNLLDADYEWVGQQVGAMDAHVVSVLEGGYNLEDSQGHLGSLPRACVSHARGLLHGAHGGGGGGGGGAANDDGSGGSPSSGGRQSRPPRPPLDPDDISSSSSSSKRARGARAGPGKEG